VNRPLRSSLSALLRARLLAVDAVFAAVICAIISARSLTRGGALVPWKTEIGGREVAAKTAQDDRDVVVTVTIIVADLARSVAFYRDVLGATVLREGEPTFLRFENVWLTINLGGGAPTDDKPDVSVMTPKDPNVLSSFLNLRVADIARCYELWRSRGAKFITEPKKHATEYRCYMRDPDGYLIEVGQTTMTATPLELYN
jgi:lactoylglutathione lyase